jgi:PAS domain S-box-containing protein
MTANTRHASPLHRGWVFILDQLRTITRPSMRYTTVSYAEYRRIRAFNATLVLAIGAMLIATSTSFLFIGGSDNAEGRIILSIGNVFVFSLCYVISQRGMWRVAAYLLFIGELLMLFAFAVSIGEEGTSVLYYMVFAMLWSGNFLSWWSWLAIIGLNIGLVGLHGWLVPSINMTTLYRDAGLFTLVACGMAMVVRFYQEQAYARYRDDLATAESNLRTTIEASTEGYYLMDAVRDARGEVVDFQIIEANTTACRQVGMTHRQLVGGLICELFPVNRKGGFFEQYKRVYLTGEPMAQEYYIPEGLPGTGWYYHQVIKTTRGVVIINRDITERKRYELDMVKRQNRLQSLIESQTNYLIRTDMNGNYTFANQRFLDQFGYTAQTIIGKSALDNVHPDDRPKTISAVEQCILEPGHPVQVSIRKIHHDGTIMWTDWEFVGITDPEEKIIEIQCVGIDASGRIEAEKARLEAEQLRIELRQQAELNDIKMRMMERISHEFRTPLSIIRSSADLLTRYTDRLSAEKRMEKISNINTEIDRLTDMLNDMSLILQGQAKPHLIKMQCDLSALLKAVVASYQIMNNQREIVVKIAADLPMVYIDQDQIELVISNLLSNAIKFSPASEPISIELTYDEQDISLSIADRGIGILPDEQDKVFDPFFRGTNFGEISGMGLGLSVVKHIINAHEGTILLDSTQGGGTTVTVKLPRISGKSKHTAPTP